jgi:hypothetical protein
MIKTLCIKFSACWEYFKCPLRNLKDIWVFSECSVRTAGIVPPNMALPGPLHNSLPSPLTFCLITTSIQLLLSHIISVSPFLNPFSFGLLICRNSPPANIQCCLLCLSKQLETDPQKALPQCWPVSGHPATLPLSLSSVYLIEITMSSQYPCP